MMLEMYKTMEISFIMTHSTGISVPLSQKRAFTSTGSYITHVFSV